MSTYFEYLPFKISLLDFGVHFYFQNGEIMPSVANQTQGPSLASPLKSKSDISNGKYSKHVAILENFKCSPDLK